MRIVIVIRQGVPTQVGLNMASVSFWGHAPISGKSKRQSIVSRSTVEVAYESMSFTICEVMRLKELLKDLGLKSLGTTPIYCENQATLAIFADPVLHENTKYLDMDCHFIRDKAQEGIIYPTYIPSSIQLADILAKQLSTAQHQLLLHKLWECVLHPSQLEGESWKK